MPYRLTRTQKLVPGDPAFGTRWATEEEIKLAGRGLYDLSQERNSIILVEAPQKNFDGHKIRVQATQNPAWYRRMGEGYWKGKRQFQLKRARVEKALKRVHDVKIVRRNGYEGKLLAILKDTYGEENRS